MPDDDAHTASDEEEEEEEDASTADSDGDSEPPVELLVTGRAKRTGAGNRIQKLIEQEEDELVEYIKKNAEDVDSEEDIDFIGDEDEDVSDAQLDSSSDDEDQGPGKVDDDLEGEKQLRKQERAEKQKKRKAQAGLHAPSTVRKKARIDSSIAATSTLPHTPTPKPKKKSDRVSWIPATDEGAVRSSSRKQTIQNKETIHLRMAEKEKQRLRQMKHMEEAERKRQAAKAPPMTQAERMAEAARVERKNAKSLNRWEESERKRAEAQKAKLEALHSRQLQGPVITWWSGLTRWVNGKLREVGIREIREAERSEEPLKVGRTSPSGIHTKSFNGLSPIINHEEMATTTEAITQSEQNSSIHQVAEPAQAGHTHQPLDAGYEPMPGLGLLDGIHYYASLPAQTENSMALDREQPPPSTNGHLAAQDDLANMGPDPIEHPAAFVEKSSTPFRPDPIIPIPQPIPQGPMVEYASRSLVALRNIDSNAMSLPELQSSILLKKRNNKLQSQWLPPSCPIWMDAANTAIRACSGTLRYYRVPCKIPRPQNRSGLRRFIRLPRDSEAAQWWV